MAKQAKKKLASQIALSIVAILLVYGIMYLCSFITFAAVIATTLETTQSIPYEQAYLSAITSQDFSEIITSAAFMIACLPALIVFIKQLIDCIHAYSDLKRSFQKQPRQATTKSSFEDIKLTQEQLDEIEYQKVLQRMPYKKKYVLTEPEKLLWKVLKKHIPQGEYIIAKPGIKEFVRTLGYDDDAVNQRAWREIAQKHVDFLVCNTYSLYPLYAIEYDGDTHDPSNPANAATIRSDSFKNQLFSEIGLPLIRIAYGTEDSVELQVKEALKNIYNPVIPNNSTTADKNQQPPSSSKSVYLDLTRKKVWTLDDPEMEPLKRILQLREYCETKDQNK